MQEYGRSRNIGEVSDLASMYLSIYPSHFVFFVILGPESPAQKKLGTHTRQTEYD